jgi:hypothetical protein
VGRGISGTFFRAEIYRGRLFCRAEIYKRRLFFRADRSLGAKQEGLTIVHFLNKLIVSCKIEEQTKIIKNNEEKNQKLLFVHVHVYA